MIDIEVSGCGEGGEVRGFSVRGDAFSISVRGVSSFSVRDEAIKLGWRFSDGVNDDMGAIRELVGIAIEHRDRYNGSGW